MYYSRRQFLKLAAGLSAAAPLLFHETAYADGSRPPKSQGPGKGVKVLDVKEQYGQAEADRIHVRSVERQIRKAGEMPEKVRERVARRIRDLKTGAVR